jgi:hypothetical protein
VVSAGAPTPALFGFQSPGDYATFNSNHTPDGTPPTNESYLISGDQLTPEQQQALKDMECCDRRRSYDRPH